MTIQTLLERLERRRDALDAAIAEIRSTLEVKATRAKAKAIVASTKRGPYKKRKSPGVRVKKHWTQTPEGREHMRRIQLARHAKKVTTRVVTPRLQA